ncbi:vesicle coat component, partial [Dissophora globulifera]
MSQQQQQPPVGDEPIPFFGGYPPAAGRPGPPPLRQAQQQQQRPALQQQQQPQPQRQPPYPQGAVPPQAQAQRHPQQHPQVMLPQGQENAFNMPPPPRQMSQSPFAPAAGLFATPPSSSPSATQHQASQGYLGHGGGTFQPAHGPPQQQQQPDQTQGHPPQHSPMLARNQHQTAVAQPPPQRPPVQQQQQQQQQRQTPSPLQRNPQQQQQQHHQTFAPAHQQHGYPADQSVFPTADPIDTPFAPATDLFGNSNSQSVSEWDILTGPEQHQPIAQAPHIQQPVIAPQPHHPHQQWQPSAQPPVRQGSVPAQGPPQGPPRQSSFTAGPHGPLQTQPATDQSSSQVPPPPRALVGTPKQGPLSGSVASQQGVSAYANHPPPQTPLLMPIQTPLMLPAQTSQAFSSGHTPLMGPLYDQFDSSSPDLVLESCPYPDCGGENKPNAKFCSECGRSISVASRSATPSLGPRADFSDAPPMPSLDRVNSYAQDYQQQLDQEQLQDQPFQTQQQPEQQGLMYEGYAQDDQAYQYQDQDQQQYAYPDQEQQHAYADQEQQHAYPSQEQQHEYPGQEQQHAYPGQEQQHEYPGQEQHYDHTGDQQHYDHAGDQQQYNYADDPQQQQQFDYAGDQQQQQPEYPGQQQQYGYSDDQQVYGQDYNQQYGQQPEQGYDQPYDQGYGDAAYYDQNQQYYDPTTGQYMEPYTQQEQALPEPEPELEEDGIDDPLNRIHGCPLIAFGFGGKIMTSFPRTVQRFDSATSLMATKKYPGDLQLEYIKDILPQDKDITAYPGPLLMDSGPQSKNKRKDILKLVEDRIKEHDQEQQYSSFDAHRVLIWRLLKVMFEQEGTLVGSPKVDEAVRSVLLSIPLSVHPPQPAQEPISPLRSSASLDVLQDLLRNGDRAGAVRYAMSTNLWAHALVISSCVNKELWKEAVNGFVNQELTAGGGEMHANGRESLRVMYALFSGQTQEAVKELIPTHLRAPVPILQTDSQTPEDQFVSAESLSMMKPAEEPRVPGESLEQWRDTLVTILSNRTSGDQTAVSSLGDLLLKEGWVEAAHICYLLSPQCSVHSGPDAQPSHLVLIGADSSPFAPFPFYKNIAAFQKTEIYEFAHASRNGSGATGGLPFLQAYKLCYIWTLVEWGMFSEAGRYLKAIEAIVKAQTEGSPYSNIVFLERLKDITERLAGSSLLAVTEESWFAKKVPKPSIGGIFDALDSKISKFIAGDNDQPKPVIIEPKASAVESGPFANAPALPDLSNIPARAISRSSNKARSASAALPTDASRRSSRRSLDVPRGDVYGQIQPLSSYPETSDPNQVQGDQYGNYGYDPNNQYGAEGYTQAQGDYNVGDQYGDQSQAYDPTQAYGQGYQEGDGSNFHYDQQDPYQEQPGAHQEHPVYEGENGYQAPAGLETHYDAQYNGPYDDQYSTPYDPQYEAQDGTQYDEQYGAFESTAGETATPAATQPNALGSGESPFDLSQDPNAAVNTAGAAGIFEGHDAPYVAQAEGADYGYGEDAAYNDQYQQGQDYQQDGYSLGGHGGYDESAYSQPPYQAVNGADQGIGAEYNDEGFLQATMEQQVQAEASVPEGAGDQQSDLQQNEFQQGDYPQGDYQQGDYPQGDYPQGNYPQGDYQQGDYPQGDYQQGDYQQGDYQQGDYQQGDYQQGDYQQGDYQQGDYQQGDYQQGNYQQGDYQQGDYQQGDYQQGDYPQGDYQQGDYAQGDYLQGDYQQGDYQQGDYQQGDYQQANGQQEVEHQPAPGEFQNQAEYANQEQQQDGSSNSNTWWGNGENGANAHEIEQQPTTDIGTQDGQHVEGQFMSLGAVPTIPSFGQPEVPLTNGGGQQHSFNDEDDLGMGNNALKKDKPVVANGDNAAAGSSRTDDASNAMGDGSDE